MDSLRFDSHIESAMIRAYTNLVSTENIDYILEMTGRDLWKAQRFANYFRQNNLNLRKEAILFYGSFLRYLPYENRSYIVK